MGKAQSKTNNNKELFDIIDKKLKSKNMSLDLKIENHYNKIRNSTTSIKLRSNSPLKISKKNKLLPKTKEEVFIKWYEMCHNKAKQNAITKQLTPLLSKTVSKLIPKNASLQTHETQFKTIETNSHIMMHQFHRTQSTNYLSEIHNKITGKIFVTKTNIKEISSPLNAKRLEKNKSHFGLKNNHTILKSLDITEKCLRDFYNINKEKFVKRTLKGPPELFRWITWLINIGIPEERNSSMYYSLIPSQLDKDIETQITKDLHRTLSEENLFLLENARNSLFRLLKAFAVYDKEVSYCQGMNFIAGYLLVISEFNEVESFFMLLSLFTKEFSTKFGIRGFFLNEFPMLKYFIYQFEHIFRKFLPELKTHFEKLEVPNELWVCKWFQALFTNCLGFEMVCRLWDCLVVQGLNFIHNFTIAVLQTLEKELFACKDLCDVAEIFNGLNPYSEGKLKKKITLNIEDIINSALKLEIPFSMVNKLKYKYEKTHKFDLSKFQQVSHDLNSSAFSIVVNEDQSVCSEFSVIESNTSISNHFPKTTKNCEVKIINYEENLKSTFLNSHNSPKNEDEISETDEKLNETSICSEVDLFEKSKIDNRMKNYILNTKIITKNNRNTSKIKLIRNLNK